MKTTKGEEGDGTAEQRSRGTFNPRHDPARNPRTYLPTYLPLPTIPVTSLPEGYSRFSRFAAVLRKRYGVAAEYREPGRGRVLPAPPNYVERIRGLGRECGLNPDSF